ncbi:MAG: GspH/FimT family pseudopilin [Desulfobulbus sp.]|nr:GspH/FimT family pseudopilin [Desulfobulbus sp.]
MLTLPRQPGFTLIELVIVMLVIGILAMLAAPNFVVWRANTEIRSVAEALQNDIRLAQNEAFRRNRQVALILTNGTPTNDGSTFTAASTAKSWAIIALPLVDAAGETESLISSYIRSGGTQITGTDGSGDALKAICFNSVGRLTASSGIANANDEQCAAPATTAPLIFAVANSAGNRPLQIQVRLGGQVRMCDPAKSSPAPDAC